MMTMNLIDYNKRRTPNIVRIPNSSAVTVPNRPYYSDVVFCGICSMRMVYAREFHVYYCNYCGNSIDPPSKHRQQSHPENRSQQPGMEAQSDKTLDLDVKYSTTDGITDDEEPNTASISSVGRNSNRSSLRKGYTRAYQFNNKHKTDFERVCAEEDRQMQKKGWQITSDRIEMPQSHNILDLAGIDKKKQQLGSNNHVRIRKY
jgi:hypothetical protein